MNIPPSHVPPSSLSGRDDLDAIGVGLGAGVSVLLHGLIVGLVILGTLHKEESIEESIEPKMLEFEEVDLMALGEEKPPEALPRIANPAPPEVQEEQVAIEPPKPDEVNIAEKEPEPKPEDAVEKEEPKENKRKKMLEALSSMHDPERPTNEDIPEGAEDGFAGGSLSDAARKNLLGAYGAKLSLKLTERWTPPATLSKEQINEQTKNVEVYVRLSKEGYIVRYTFRQESGNPQIDASIERAIRRYQVSGGGKTLPLPDKPEVRDIVLRDGLNLKTWEYKGR